MWGEQDFLHRQIRQLAQALARLLGRTAKDDEHLVAGLLDKEAELRARGEHAVATALRERALRLAG